MTGPDNLRIREFRVSDLVPVRQLIHDTIDICYPPVYPPLAVEFFKVFHSEEEILERHRKGDILVVEEDGVLVATGSRVGNEILGVFVLPEYQGHGLGKALMVDLEKRAKAEGFAETELSVSLPSRQFYEGLGYEILETCSIDVGAGETLDFWKARKQLR